MKKSIALLATCMLLTACGSSNTQLSVNEQATITTTETTTAITTTQQTTATETTTTIAETISAPIDGITRLYKDAFLPFADGIGKMNFEKAREIAESLSYEKEITVPTDDDLGQIKIIDENGDYVWMMTYYDSSNIEVLSLLTYRHGDFEISTGDEYHSSTIYFNTYDKNRDNPNKKVSSLEKCELFMFGCSSGENNK